MILVLGLADIEFLNLSFQIFKNFFDLCSVLFTFQLGRVVVKNVLNFPSIKQKLIVRMVLISSFVNLFFQFFKLFLNRLIILIVFSDSKILLHVISNSIHIMNRCKICKLLNAILHIRLTCTKFNLLLNLVYCEL